MKNVNHKLRELTPASYKCGSDPYCPAVYELVREECVIGACPAVFELAKENCGSGLVCPAVFGTDDDKFLIIGKKLDPKEFGLDGKVGKDETLISVPKGLIEKLKK